MADEDEGFRRLDKHHQDDAQAPWRLSIIEWLAPNKFYTWPLWKKLLIVIPVAILFFAGAYLRAMGRR